MLFDQELDNEKWQNLAKTYSTKEEEIIVLLETLPKMLKNDTIVIINNNHLADLVGLSIDTLLKIINSSKSFYYSFTIPKRRGGVRNISSPYPTLLKAQRWIYENILIKQEIHKSAKGFIKNVSIKDNAREHLDKEFLLKIDIEDFFPSITIKRVIAIFKRLGYSQKISFSLASICCLNQCLPQGAPTSPILSNIIAKKLDNRLHGLSIKFDTTYTRYADDLAFSSEKIPFLIMYKYIDKILKEEGFQINEKKTQFVSRGSQKIITGISISSDKMTIPKKKKREIRQSVYFILKRGLFEHQEAIGNFDPIYIDRLIGYLHFWQFIEPENEFVRQSILNIKDKLRELEANYIDLLDINLLS